MFGSPFQYCRASGVLSLEMSVLPQASLNMLQPGSGPQFGRRQVLDLQGLKVQNHLRVTSEGC